MDAFYAAVETLSNPLLKGKPMAVGGMSMISTANYEVWITSCSSIVLFVLLSIGLYEIYLHTAPFLFEKHLELLLML